MRPPLDELRRAGSGGLIPMRGKVVMMMIVLGMFVWGIVGCGSHSASTATSPTATHFARAQVGAATTSPAGANPVASAAAGDGPPRGLTEAQLRVDRDDPDRVAAAFVIRLEAWDTRLDRRPNDAARRAAPFASAQLATQLLSADPVAAPGRRWNQLQRHHGWTSVQARLGGLGPPPTGDRTAVRAVTCTRVDHGADGWIAFPEPGGTYLVRLARRARSGWTVVGYTIQ